MKKRITNLRKNNIIWLTGLSLLLVLSSCSRGTSDANAIATVDKEVITSEEFRNELEFYHSYYTSLYGSDFWNEKDKKNKTYKQVLKDDLIDSMIKDRVMLNDLKNNKVKVDENLAIELKNKLTASLNGEDSLRANIDALGVNEASFEDILYNDSIRESHYDYFLEANSIKDKEILEYYEKDENLHRMYKYDALIFEDETFAKLAKEEINSSEDFKKKLNQGVKNFEVYKSDFVYADDDLLSLSKLKEKEVVSDVIAYEDKYVILMINSHNDNKTELLINAKDIYLKNAYEKYLNDLVKKSKIKVFVWKAWNK